MFRTMRRWRGKQYINLGEPAKTEDVVAFKEAWTAGIKLDPSKPPRILINGQWTEVRYCEKCGHNLMHRSETVGGYDPLTGKPRAEKQWWECTWNSYGSGHDTWVLGDSGWRKK